MEEAIRTNAMIMDWKEKGGRVRLLLFLEKISKSQWDGGDEDRVGIILFGEIWLDQNEE